MNSKSSSISCGYCILCAKMNGLCTVVNNHGVEALPAHEPYMKPST